MGGFFQIWPAESMATQFNNKTTTVHFQVYLRNFPSLWGQMGDFRQAAGRQRKVIA